MQKSRASKPQMDRIDEFYHEHFESEVGEWVIYAQSRDNWKHFENVFERIARK